MDCNHHRLIFSSFCPMSPVSNCTGSHCHQQGRGVGVRCQMGSINNRITASIMGDQRGDRREPINQWLSGSVDHDHDHRHLHRSGRARERESQSDMGKVLSRNRNLARPVWKLPPGRNGQFGLNLTCQKALICLKWFDERKRQTPPMRVDRRRCQCR